MAAKKLARLPTSHASKSQIAARLVKKGLFPGPEIDGRRAGDLGEELAKKHGTNREYLFQAVRLQKRSAEIFELVVSGHLNIPQAHASLELRKESPRKFANLFAGEWDAQKVRQALRRYLIALRPSEESGDPVRKVKKWWSRCSKAQREHLRKWVESNN
jgi:hypothetical protein